SIIFERVSACSFRWSKIQKIILVLYVFSFVKYGKSQHLRDKKSERIFQPHKMVSLGNENGRRGNGAYFFDLESSITAPDHEELLQDQTVLSADLDPPFRKINTTWAIVMQLILMICLGVAAGVLPEVCTERLCGMSPYSYVIYAHAVMWFIIVLLDRYLRLQHYYSRTNGYLEFYRKTRRIRRVPFMVLSGGNAMLVVVLKVLEDYCPMKHIDPRQSCPGLPLSRSNYIQVLVSIEVIISTVCLIIYLVQTVRFNSHAHAPDVHQDEMMTSFLQSQNNTSDIGFRDEEYLDQVLEKQADMIRYLKQHNAHLGQKIMKLTQQLNTKTRNDSNGR
ncbi:unnamed protein product, partial [Owenia fusiformis]